MKDIIAVRAGQVITPLTQIENATLIIEGRKISVVGPAAEIPIPAGCEVIDASDRVVAPGFVDTHIHGWGGSHFGESCESTASMCQSIVSTGTTGLLPTLMTEPTLAGILKRIEVVREVMQHPPAGAGILGIHMEGPFVNPEDGVRGSQESAYLRQPSLGELQRMIEASEGSIRKMSIASELDGALPLIREMAANGIVPSAGHSAASYDQTLAAVAAGLSCATHTFNGMHPLHHRRPGLVGAVLTQDSIWAELIADGQHVSSQVIEILVRCKGVDGVHIVTDNTLWAGQPDGKYQARGGRVVVKDGMRVYVEGGTLFGSVAPMNYAIANVARTTPYSLAESIRMATLNPSIVIGLAYRKGSLAPGKDADLVVIDKDVNVYLTMVGGDIVYRAQDA